MPRAHGAALRTLLTATAATLLLAGCDIPGLGPDARTLQREAEAKAIGGACRHALRGLEDCYTLNPKAAKAQVFAGWKDMDQYMRENKIEGTPSVLTQLEKPAEAPKPKRSRDGDDGSDEPRNSRNRG
ncbi:hypothetical protein C6568_15155 [Melaminivora suipulveris]|uniref:Uncharacterized protein n=1 Tax=Melaminivora suipulveris TaxID=2109913 RepID=A0A2R3QF66_9BURK|nr:hypothetical protein [Melaminivora suipulveris]AVO50426.1 hypothetical protein C6568_15155 [Melaminivora suipulveris]